MRDQGQQPPRRQAWLRRGAVRPCESSRMGYQELSRVVRFIILFSLRLPFIRDLLPRWIDIPVATVLGD